MDDVGIGTTDPEGLLQADTANSSGLIVQSSGNVGIGTTSPAQKLDINGAIKVGGTYPSYFSGNVGVGTTLPTAVLHIKSATTAPALGLYCEDGLPVIKKAGTCVQMQLTIAGTTGTNNWLVVTCP